MPGVNQVIQRLEGMVGSTSNAAGHGGLPSTGDAGRAGTAVATWVEGCKAIMRQPALKDQTDWDFVCARNVIQTGIALDATSGTLYALLIKTDSADAELDWVAIYDNTIQTFDGTAALANSVIAVYRNPATGTDNVSEYHGLLFPDGLVYATALAASADGQDGANPAATDIDVYALVRT